MDNRMLNGRVNILQPDTKKQFALYDKIPAHQPSSYRDALQGNWNDSPLSIDLPNQVKCKIETTDVALKGQTVSSSYKPAVLNNGLNIQVPPFIESGDEIIVDTRNLEYVKKI